MAKGKSKKNSGQPQPQTGKMAPDNIKGTEKAADKKKPFNKKRWLIGIEAAVGVIIVCVAIVLISTWKDMSDDFHTVRELRVSGREDVLSTYLKTSNDVKGLDISSAVWECKTEGEDGWTVLGIISVNNQADEEFEFTEKEMKIDQDTSQVITAETTTKLTACEYLRRSLADYLNDYLTQNGLQGESVQQEVTEVKNHLIVRIGPSSSEITSELGYIIREGNEQSAEAYIHALKEAYMDKFVGEVFG